MKTDSIPSKYRVPLTIAREDLMSEDVKTALRGTASGANRAFQSGFAFPMLGVLGMKRANGKIEPLPVPMSDAPTKEIAIGLLKTACRALEPEFVLIACEAWVRLRVSKEEAESIETLIGDPKAQDAFTIQVETYEGVWNGHGLIPAYETQKVRRLESMRFMFSSEGEGRMLGMLPPRGTQQ